MDHVIKRRTLLRNTGLLGAGLLLGRSALANHCNTERTPGQPEGPFFPTPSQQENQQDTNTDLTQIDGRAGVAAGQVTMVTGQVLNDHCKPIPGALVEIWQACETGKYNHPNDGNDAPLDPNFQYWARTTTNANGEYGFKTIKPGAYPNSSTWTRPSHIHFRVIAPGFPSLTTQMYFEGDALLEEDLILNRLPAQARELVVIPFVEESGILRGQFKIVLSQSANPLRTPDLD